MIDISKIIESACSQIRKGVELANLEIDSNYKGKNNYKIELPGSIEFDLQISGGHVKFSVIVLDFFSNDEVFKENDQDM